MAMKEMGSRTRGRDSSKSSPRIIPTTTPGSRNSNSDIVFLPAIPPLPVGPPPLPLLLLLPVLLLVEVLVPVPRLHSSLRVTMRSNPICFTRTISCGVRMTSSSVFSKDFNLNSKPSKGDSRTLRRCKQASQEIIRSLKAQLASSSRSGSAGSGQTGGRGGGRGKPSQNPPLGIFSSSNYLPPPKETLEQREGIPMGAGGLKDDEDEEEEDSSNEYLPKIGTIAKTLGYAKRTFAQSKKYQSPARR